ncbi:MAG: NUDIX domain-containing protein [Asticcacaulis sp.]|nr:NUDIX domain-containing protein [Asticcacaulis sp.]MBW8880842.1 NUDIX domain-containing protein [Asticcacaulis sp.]
MKDWKRIVEPYSRPLFFAWSRLTRGKTLGVRGLVLDDQGRVLLIEHTYVEGWWLPGGGVDAGETTHAAVARELREEAGINPIETPTLLSVHSNETFFPGDHVLLFRVERWERCEMTSHGEIKNVDFFAPDALPDNTNRGTRRRIEEALKGVPVDVRW